MGAPVFSWWETVVEGARGEWPPELTEGEVRALRWCRAGVVCLPLTGLLLGGVLFVVGQEMEAVVDEVDPLLILLTLGLILLAFVPLLVMAAAAKMMGALLMVLGVPLGILQAWAIGRLLDPGDPPQEGALAVLALTGIVGLVAGLMALPSIALVLAPLPLVPFVGWWRLRRARRAAREAEAADALPPPS